MRLPAPIFIINRILSVVVTLSAIFFSTPAFSAGYYNTTFGFKARLPRLAMTTTAQNLYASLCSGVVTVQTRNGFGIATNVGSNLTVNLSAPAGVTFYTDSSCTTTTATVTVATGTSSASYYFISTTTGSKDVLATATGYLDASQTETVTTNPFVWTGGGGNTTWSTAGNWSGGAAPGVGNVALFDGTCSSNCSPTITANISTAGLRMSSGYAGTITQNAGVTITIGASGWVQLAGIFAGGDSTITINAANLILSGGTFNAGTTTVLFNIAVTTNKTFYLTAGATIFNNLTLRGASYNGGVMSVSSNLTVAGTLVVDNPNAGGNQINGGPILALGDVTAATNGRDSNGSAVIKMVGTGNSVRSLTGVSTANIGEIEIAACAGCTVNVFGTIVMKSVNFTYTSGIVNTGTSTFLFDMGAPTNLTRNFSSGDIVFNNLTFNGGAYNGGIIAVPSNLTVNGVLQIDSGAGPNRIDGGPILVLGDISATNYGRYGSSTAVIKMVGTGNSTHSLTGTANANLGKLEIASCAGCTVNMAGSILVQEANFTYTSGIVNAGTSTFIFNMNVPNNTTYSLSAGTLNFYNLTLKGGDYNGGAINASSNLTVTGTLILDDSTPGGKLKVATGPILAQGNVSITGFGVNGTSGITFTGGNNATVAVAAAAGVQNSTWIVNKTAATVSLLNNLNLAAAGQSLTVSTGTLDMNAKNLTINGVLTIAVGATLTCNGGTLTYGSLVNNGTLTCP